MGIFCFAFRGEPETISVGEHALRKRLLTCENAAHSDISNTRSQNTVLRSADSDREFGLLPLGSILVVKVRLDVDVHGSF